MSAPVDARLEAIRQAAHAELERAGAPRPWWVDAAALVGLNALAGLVLAVVLPPNQVQHSSLLLRWVGAALLAVLGVGGAVAAVRPGWRQVRVVLLALASLVVLVLLAAASGVGTGGFWAGAGCGVVECAASLVPVAATLLVLSRFAPDVERTLVGGLAAGTGGLFALHLHCPNGTLSHLVGWHLVPWLVLCALVLGLRRLLRSATWAP